MEYRRMGKFGLKLSAFSLGTWVTFGRQINDNAAKEILVAAYEHGVNFFDGAEGYAGGKAEATLGKLLKEMGWRRESYVVSTKIFWGGTGVNEFGLSYKHIMEGINKSLTRLQMDYVDLLFCHLPDPETPIEEIVWAMDQVTRQGKAFYWGISNWSAADIMLADGIARQNGLRPPCVLQPQYNLLYRERMEKEYISLFRNLGYGSTVWSPLASGLLSGKYNNGIPADSRLNVEGYDWLKDEVIFGDRLEKVRNLQKIADDLGCSLAQLSLAWVLKNPDVSTVITGASRVEQVHENMKALDVLPQLSDEVMASIENTLSNQSK